MNSITKAYLKWKLAELVAYLVLGIFYTAVMLIVAYAFSPNGN